MDNALNSINPINSSNNPLNYMEEILSHQICGFHQYVLTPPVHLNYASCNLCELLGVKENELLFGLCISIQLGVSPYSSTQSKLCVRISEISKGCKSPVFKHNSTFSFTSSLLGINSAFSSNPVADASNFSLLLQATTSRNKQTSKYLITRQALVLKINIQCLDEGINAVSELFGTSMV